MKYTVSATIGVDVTATIEAEDADDAERQLDSADVTVESCDNDITFNNCCQINCNVDSVSCDGEKKWNDLSKFNRMEILRGNDVTDDAAYDIAGRSFENIPTEWKGYFG